MPNGATLSPDASWVSRERWEALLPEEKDTFANICPDFVVELRSESDSLQSLQAKMQEYLDYDARLGWLMDPKNQRVEIYLEGKEGKEVEILEHPAELSGEDVLPGFVLNLHLIWCGVSESDILPTLMLRIERGTYSPPEPSSS